MIFKNAQIRNENQNTIRFQILNHDECKVSKRDLKSILRLFFSIELNDNIIEAVYKLFQKST